MYEAQKQDNLEAAKALSNGMRRTGGMFDLPTIMDLAASLSPRPGALTPARQASGWANCRMTWIVSGQCQARPRTKLGRAYEAARSANKRA
jgi:hypothetical protein